MRLWRAVIAKHAPSQEVEVCATIHLAFKELQAVDLPLGLSVTPRGRKGIDDSREILSDAIGKGNQRRNARGDHILNPGYQIAWLVVAHHLLKRVNQAMGQCDSRVGLLDTFQGLLFFFLQAGFGLEQEPSGACGTPRDNPWRPHGWYLC